MPNPLQGYPTAASPAGDDWLYLQGDTLSIRKLSPTFFPTAAATAANIAIKLSILQPESAVPALDIDVTKSRNTKNISSGVTFTFSATPSTGQSFGLRINNTSGASVGVQIPESYSLALSALRTSFTILSGQIVEIFWFYNGTSFYMIGDPVLPTDLDAAGITGADLIVFYHNLIPKYLNYAQLKLDILSTATAGGYLSSSDFSKSSDTTLENFLSAFVSDGVLTSGKAVSFTAKFFVNASAIGGAKFSVDTDNVETSLIYQITATNASTGAIISTARISTQGASFTATPGATSMFVTIQGSFIPDASGGVNFNFAQAVASGTSTVLKGSSCNLNFPDKL